MSLMQKMKSRKNQLIAFLILNAILLVWSYGYVIAHENYDGISLLAIAVLAAATLYSFVKMLTYYWDKY
jgi:hypothetical protein